MPAKLKLADDNGCFACGTQNPIGLKLEFAVEGEEYVTYFTPRKEHQGYVGVAHGGLITTVLDESMARYLHVLGKPALTAELTVRFKRAAEIGKRLKVTARIDSENHRVIECSAKAVDDGGTLIAEALGRWVRIG